MTVTLFGHPSANPKETDPMRWDHDGMLVVRAELCDRLDLLQRTAGRRDVRELVQGIAALRSLADAYGMTPVVRLADAFQRAIQREPRHCLAGLYFDRIRDSIGCERRDEAAGETYLASVSVRLVA